MTRREIQASGLRRARHILKSAGKEDELLPNFDDPWLLDEYTNDVTTTLYRAGSRLYLQLVRNIVSGQAQYPFPQAMELDDATWQKPDGTTGHLTLVNEGQMRAYDPMWRVSVQTGTPMYLIDLGDTLELWPVPDFDQANGLTIYGIGPLSAGDWGADDECPILPDFHATIAKGLALKIAASVADSPMARTVALDFKRDKGHFESQNATRTSARRNRSGGSYQARTDYYGNPLNL